MAPLVVYGIQDATGAWNFDDPAAYRDFYRLINGSYLWMEVATLAASLAALRFYPFGFITMLAAVALWFMSMDLAVWFYHGLPWSEAWE
ncbi:hypothetical protein J8J27_26990, partial [Mycobacterium tuberculosis]|nr:hypothetical protein [Mycobacterium tuberculosis]